MAILAVIIVLVAAGPVFPQKTIEQIITWVNADIILKSEYDAKIKQLSQQLAQQRNLQGTQLEQAVAEQSRDLLRDLIDMKLVVQVAKDMGLNADLDVIRQMERLRQDNNMPSMEALEEAMRQQGMNVEETKQDMKNNILMQQVIQREVYHKVQVTTEEQLAYYEANKKNFDKPEGIRLSEIGISIESKTPAEVEEQKKKAEEALAAIKRGDNFAEVAQKYSETQTAGGGGDLGFFEKGQLAAPLEEAASKLEKGQTTEIISRPDGFIILKVTDRHSGGILPFELAQDQISDLLWSERIRPKIREYLTRLRVEGFVKVSEGYVDTGAPPKTAAEIKPGRN
jgi:peptidyl-prolyl cis-trans isomerase SurA